ncbi:hypothetical protein L6452_01964 [Arctium lappa]|uniref:Uncharacterized protein n=1 Tax=Arctium lappa TaxID=4217 RepID=A0ACB9FHT1_ARCLA|nr:hypothetical protein L6452_01964 [Arctium lappa]
MEGRRYEEKKFDDRRSDEKNFGEKKPEKRYLNDYGEKKVDRPVKCYNCGKLGHFVQGCWKPIVWNSDYYKNKMLLAKQKDVRKSLIVEDDYWLDHSDDENKEETAHMCLMGKEVKYDESDEEIPKEVNNFSESDFLKKMETMMVELQDLQAKLKKEKSRACF